MSTKKEQTLREIMGLNKLCLFNNISLHFIHKIYQKCRNKKKKKRNGTNINNKIIQLTDKLQEEKKVTKQLETQYKIKQMEYLQSEIKKEQQKQSKLKNKIKRINDKKNDNEKKNIITLD